MGRGKYTKAIDYRAKGKSGLITHPEANINIYIKEKDNPIPEKFVKIVNIEDRRLNKPVKIRLDY